MKQKMRIVYMVCLDLFVVNLSVMVAYLLRFDIDYTKIPENFTSTLIKVLIVSSIIKIGIFYIFKLYTSLWRYASVYELVLIFMAALASNIILFSYINIFNVEAPRSVCVIMFFIDIFLVGGVRFAYRVIRKLIKSNFKVLKNSKRVLIFGGGDSGAVVIHELKRHPELTYKPVVIIDNDITKSGKKINGVPIVGDERELLKATRDYKVDEIIIAVRSENNKEINKIYNECSKTNCKVKILPAIAQLIDESVVINKIRDVNIEDLLGREPVSLNNQEISGYLYNNVIVVTGGGGSIGSELCRQIARYSPKELIIIDNYENNAYEIQNELMKIYPELNLNIVMANVREKHRLEIIFKKINPDVVFHAAAHKHVPLMEANPTEAIQNNIFGTLNVAECADKFGVKKFVLISTDKAVNPTNIMGATKRVAEMIIQGINNHSKTEFVAVRFGNVLGSNGSVIPLFKKQIKSGGPLTVTHPDITRFFMTIPEASQLVLQAGGMAKGGEIFVLDMGQPVKIHDLAKNLIKLSGYEPETDIEINFTGLRPGEKLYEELLLEEEGLKTTRNNKIYVAQPVVFNYKKLKSDIEFLKDVIFTNPENAVEFMKLLVPTYKKFSKTSQKGAEPIRESIFKIKDIKYKKIFTD